ncbi:hypothetical protein MSPP1_002063 [Malassezia sp. CBS 17886]|nr:hypothetical protein MSPP1_002063 [Malassezia sp. CBS 17886]
MDEPPSHFSSLDVETGADENGPPYNAHADGDSSGESAVDDSVPDLWMATKERGGRPPNASGALADRFDPDTVKVASDWEWDLPVSETSGSLEDVHAQHALAMDGQPRAAANVVPVADCQTPGGRAEDGAGAGRPTEEPAQMRGAFDAKTAVAPATAYAHAAAGSPEAAVGARDAAACVPGFATDARDPGAIVGGDTSGRGHARAASRDDWRAGDHARSLPTPPPPSSPLPLLGNEAAAGDLRVSPDAAAVLALTPPRPARPRLDNEALLRSPSGAQLSGTPGPTLNPTQVSPALQPMSLRGTPAKRRSIKRSSPWSKKDAVATQAAATQAAATQAAATQAAATQAAATQAGKTSNGHPSGITQCAVDRGVGDDAQSVPATVLEPSSDTARDPAAGSAPQTTSENSGEGGAKQGPTAIPAVPAAPRSKHRKTLSAVMREADEILQEWS